MAMGEAVITGQLMATGEAEIQSVQTTCDGVMVTLRDHRFVCWPSSWFVGIVALLVGCLASSSLVVLIFVALELGHKYIMWSIMGMDIHLV